MLDAGKKHAMRDYARESFWFDTLDEGLSPRPPLDVSDRCDIAIVGGGYTGLWTAYALKKRDPALDVRICESDVVGAGASGRNGGWCMGEMSGVRSLLSHPRHGDAARRLQAQLFRSVDEIGSIAESEGIDCDFKKGGALKLARLPAHRVRMQEELARLRDAGFGDDCYRFLTAEECAERVRGQDFSGALFSVHMAALNPARLVRGLARAVEAQGVRLYEGSPVREIRRAGLRTDRAHLDADRVVLATEGFTPRVKGRRRRLIPIHSMMIATEPLSASMWDSIGLRDRELFGDWRRVTVYGQRTADDRIAFGGRGVYTFGSQARTAFSPDEPIFERVREGMLSLLPQLESVEITHRWGGPLGVPRDGTTRVQNASTSGPALGGGYVGEGVMASYWIGSTLADLLTDQATERTEMSWLQRDFPLWEIEPLRWLGVTGVRRLAERLDEAEERGRKANPFLSRLCARFLP